MDNDCNSPLHPKALEGLKLFNQHKFFEAHEELEQAWLAEKSEARNLYRGVLQIAVAYLHISRGNFNGAVKVHQRSIKWLKDWPEICRGIHVGKLRKDAQNTLQEIERLGPENIKEFDLSTLAPVEWDKKRVWVCDRCGATMHEKNCKVSCPNCGNRFDCSDLNLYFD